MSDTIENRPSVPPSPRTDTFRVGDIVEYHIPTVMMSCRTWAPDTTKPATIIAVRDVGPEHMQRNAGHTQYVRVSPNYSPHGDEFSGAWFKPVGRDPEDALIAAHDDITRIIAEDAA